MSPRTEWWTTQATHEPVIDAIGLILDNALAEMDEPLALSDRDSYIRKDLEELDDALVNAAEALRAKDREIGRLTLELRDATRLAKLYSALMVRLEAPNKAVQDAAAQAFIDGHNGLLLAPVWHAVVREAATVAHKDALAAVIPQ